MNRLRVSQDESNDSSYHPRQALQTPLEEHLTKILAPADLARLTLVSDNARPPPITTSANADAKFPMSHSDHYRRMMILSRTSTNRSLFRSSSDGPEALQLHRVRRRDFCYEPIKASKGETRWTSESLPTPPSASTPVPSLRRPKRSKLLLDKKKNKGGGQPRGEHSSVRPVRSREVHRTKNNARHLALTTPTRIASPPSSPPALLPAPSDDNSNIEIRHHRCNDVALAPPPRRKKALPSHLPPQTPSRKASFRATAAAAVPVSRGIESSPMARWDSSDGGSGGGSGDDNINDSKFFPNEFSFADRHGILDSSLFAPQREFASPSIAPSLTNVACNISESIASAAVATAIRPSTSPQAPPPPPPPPPTSIPICHPIDVAPPPSPRRLHLPRQCSDSVLVLPRRTPSMESSVGDGGGDDDDDDRNGGCGGNTYSSSSSIPTHSSESSDWSAPSSTVQSDEGTSNGHSVGNSDGRQL